MILKILLISFYKMMISSLLFISDNLISFRIDEDLNSSMNNDVSLMKEQSNLNIFRI